MKQAGIFRPIAGGQAELCRFAGLRQAFPAHFHAHYTVGVVLRGRWLSACAGAETPVSAGDLILLDPYTSHSCRPLGGEALDYCGLNITAQAVRACLPGLWQEGKTLQFPSVPVRDETAQGLLWSLCCGKVNVRPGLAQLLEHLARLDYPRADAASALRQERQGVRQAQQLIEADSARALSLDELGARVGLSKFQLLRSFTRQTGLSPGRYRESLRIQQARRLLRAGARPVDVGYEVGFCDQSEFTKCFKALVGATPGQYQRGCMGGTGDGT